MDLDPEEVQRLAQVFSGFSQRTRLALLLGFYNGQQQSEVADHLGISRAGLQGHLEKMLEAELIRRKNGQGYVLTPMGRFFAEQILEQSDAVIESLDALNDAEQRLEDQLGDGLDEADKRRVRGLKWSLAEDRIKGLLKKGDED
jgi:DNA-binding MarR family transcriptional regulator